MGIKNIKLLNKKDEIRIKKYIKKALMLMKLSGDKYIDKETYLDLIKNKRLLAIISRNLNNDDEKNKTTKKANAR